MRSAAVRMDLFLSPPLSPSKVPFSFPSFFPLSVRFWGYKV